MLSRLSNSLVKLKQLTLNSLSISIAAGDLLKDPNSFNISGLRVSILLIIKLNVFESIYFSFLPIKLNNSVAVTLLKYILIKFLSFIQRVLGNVTYFSSNKPSKIGSIFPPLCFLFSFRFLSVTCFLIIFFCFLNVFLFRFCFL